MRQIFHTGKFIKVTELEHLSLLKRQLQAKLAVVTARIQDLQGEKSDEHFCVEREPSVSGEPVVESETQVEDGVGDCTTS
jgi:predicted kinase